MPCNNHMGLSVKIKLRCMFVYMFSTADLLEPMANNWKRGPPTASIAQPTGRAPSSNHDGAKKPLRFRHVHLRAQRPSTQWCRFISDIPHWRVDRVVNYITQYSDCSFGDIFRFSNGRFGKINKKKRLATLTPDNGVHVSQQHGLSDTSREYKTTRFFEKKTCTAHVIIK